MPELILLREPVDIGPQRQHLEHTDEHGCADAQIARLEPTDRGS